MGKSSFISVFYPTLYNEYIQYLINGENITDEYVSGYDEELLKQLREENYEGYLNTIKEYEKEEVKEVA